MLFAKPMMNNTRNQHYLSQAEQRLNAANPNASRSNLRIYSFKVEDRDGYKIALESTKGRAIDSNLSMLDLFTFDTTHDKRLRHNLEGFFQKYEANVAAHTMSLLDKLKARSNDIAVELAELFAAKLLNFIRNPFCVEKVLNTFPGVGSFHPTDPILLASFYRIIAGVKPQQAYLCRELGISDQRYNEWLRVIFLLLMPGKEGKLTLYEGIVKALLEDKKRYWGVFIFDYDDRPCLLSDRGYSQPLPDDDSLSFSFNLCSTAFVQYCSVNPRKLLEGRAHPEFLDDALANREKLSLPTIQVTHLHNHMPMLAQYNRRVIEQCHSRVYCSKKDGIVLAG
jgi:hypothetical protein